MYVLNYTDGWIYGWLVQLFDSTMTRKDTEQDPLLEEDTRKENREPSAR